MTPTQERAEKQKAMRKEVVESTIEIMKKALMVGK